MPSTSSNGVLSLAHDGQPLIQPNTASKEHDHGTRSNSNNRGKNKKKTKKGDEAIQTTPPPKSSPAKFLGPQHPCMDCKEEVGQFDSIQCDRCKGWLHQKCSGTTHEEFKFLETHPLSKILWYCDSCLNDSKGGAAVQDVRMAQQSVTLEALHQIVLTLQNQNATIQSQNETILQLLKRESKLEEKIESHVKEALVDAKEKEEKKDNIIIFNIAELKEGESQEEETRKVNEVLKIAHPELSYEDDVKVMTRLGERRQHHDAKPRPVKLQLSGVRVKNAILKGTKNFKNHTRYEKIGITKDKTTKEQQQDRKLRDEVAKMKKEGHDAVIFRGAAVLRKDRDETLNKEKIERERSNTDSTDLKGAVGGAPTH